MFAILEKTSRIYTNFRSHIVEFVIVGSSLFVFTAPAFAVVPAATASQAPVELVVTGSIAAKCELGQGGQMDLGELGPGISIAARLGLSCNLPFDLSIRSDNGGLTHTSKPAGEGPYVGSLGYCVSIDVPLTSTTAQSQLTASYTSSNLRNGASLSSGGLIAQGGGTLRLTTQAASGAGLLAGDYVDQIVVTLNTRI
jgi:hypothetical protein